MSEEGLTDNKMGNYIVLRNDGIVVHTKRMSYKKAQELLNKYVSNGEGSQFYRLSVRLKYLNQYGNAMKFNFRHFDDFKKDVVGVYKSKEEFLNKMKNYVGKTMLKNLEEFLDEPIKPEKLQFNRRGPMPAIRYIYLENYKYIRRNFAGFKYVVPTPNEYDYYESNYNYYGVSFYNNTIWIWREIGNGDFEAIIIKKDADIDQVLKDLSNMDHDDLESVKELVSKINLSNLEIPDQYYDYLNNLINKINVASKLLV